MKRLPRYKNPPPPLPVKVKLITRCDELMLDKFIYCLTTGDLKALVIAGNVPEIELQDVWNDILSEFAELMESEHYMKVIRLTKEINFYHAKFQIVEVIVNVLEIQYSEDLVKELKKLGFPGQYNPDIESRYHSELKAAYSKSKVFLVNAENKKRELDEMEQKAGAGDKMDRKYFDGMVIGLSQWCKYQVKENEISVSKYCMMVKSMSDYVDQLKKKN